MSKDKTSDSHPREQDKDSQLPIQPVNGFYPPQMGYYPPGYPAPPSGYPQVGYPPPQVGYPSGRYPQPPVGCPDGGYRRINIPPVKPYPPDPYINQYPLPEALYKGTLFRWLYDPYEDPYRE